METFIINVRRKTYTVEPVEQGPEMQFKIFTDCNYLMTLRLDENGDWSANKDVAVMDESLVYDIGAAIELEEV